MFVYRASYELGTLSTWFRCCVTVFLFSEPTENDHGVKQEGFVHPGDGDTVKESFDI